MMTTAVVATVEEIEEIEEIGEIEEIEETERVDLNRSLVRLMKTTIGAKEPVLLGPEWEEEGEVSEVIAEEEEIVEATKAEAEDSEETVVATEEEDSEETVVVTEAEDSEAIVEEEVTVIVVEEEVLKVEEVIHLRGRN